MATAFNIKDFVSSLGVKVRGVTGLGAGTDEVLPAHTIQDSAGNEVLGTKIEARSTATDTTSVSFMQVFKQISFSIQALVTAFGSAWTRGGGAKDSNTQRVTIATDDQLPGLADNADGVAATSSLTNAGVVARLFGWNGSTYDRLQVDSAKNLKVTDLPSTTGGFAAPFVSLDLDESEEEIKSGAGCLYKLRLTNRTTSARYVKLYDGVLAGVTVGTTAPIDVIPLPGGASADLCTVLTENFGGKGLPFTTGLCIAATTGLANNDTGAPGANDVVATAYYK